MIPTTPEMTAGEILAEMKKLADREAETKDPKDLAVLHAAIASMDEYILDAKEESPEEPKLETPDKPAGVVDTGVLTGPREGLKNYLVKKQQDNDAE